LFEIVITITVVDIAGMAKLYIDSEADFMKSFLLHNFSKESSAFFVVF